MPSRFYFGKKRKKSHWKAYELRDLSDSELVVCEFFFFFFGIQIFFFFSIIFSLPEMRRKKIRKKDCVEQRNYSFLLFLLLKFFFNEILWEKVDFDCCVLTYVNVGGFFEKASELCNARKGGVREFMTVCDKRGRMGSNYWFLAVRNSWTSPEED